MGKQKNEDAVPETDGVPEVFPDDDRADAAKAEDANQATTPDADEEQNVGEGMQSPDAIEDPNRVVNNGDVSDPGNSGGFGTA